MNRNHDPREESLGRLAIQMRMLSREDLDRAKELAGREGRSLEQVLLEQGILRERDLQEILLALETTGVYRKPGA